MANSASLSDDPCGIVHAVGISAECAGRLREAGLLHAAAYVQDATSSLRLAMQRALSRAQQIPVMQEAQDEHEQLIVEDGRTTGTMLVPTRIVLGNHLHCGSGLQVEAGSFRGRIPTIAQRDLGMALLASSKAIAFVGDDLCAALLRRALATLGWVEATTRSRWATSDLGAATVVRLMRAGLSAPALRMSRTPSLDQTTLGLIADLGWHPEVTPRAL